MTECETCGGTGQLMEMVCYGGMPYEVIEICPDCDGTGQIYEEKEEPAKPPRPNRVRDW